MTSVLSGLPSNLSSNLISNGMPHTLAVSAMPPGPHADLRSRSKLWSLTHLSDAALVQHLALVAEQEHRSHAELIAHIAEVDHRKLHLAAGSGCMRDYCVHRLHMSEDTALKRVRVGRVARRFPAIFDALADGRLGLSAILLLAPRLTPGNTTELLEAAAYKTNEQILRLLAGPVSAGATAGGLGGAQNCSDAVAMTCGASAVAVRPPVLSDSPDDASLLGTLALGIDAATSGAATAAALPLFAKFTPVTLECYSLQGRVSAAAFAHFERLRALLGHTLSQADSAAVLEYAIKTCADALERRKFGTGVSTRRHATPHAAPHVAPHATPNATPHASPGAAPHAVPGRRHVPTAMRRAVLERDGMRCAFVSEDGCRCMSCVRLEIDHIVPLALGGSTTVANLRLLCREHNQYEARRRLGADHVHARQEQAHAERVRERQRKALRAARAQARATRNDGADARAQVATPVAPDDPLRDDILLALRGLRFTREEAAQGADLGAHMRDATLMQRVRVALQGLGRAYAERHRGRPSGES